MIHGSEPAISRAQSSTGISGVAVITGVDMQSSACATKGLFPLATTRHTMSQNFWKPRSLAKPASVTT